LGRPIGKHIDNQELDALVPTSSEGGHEPHKLSPEIVSEAESHAATCEDCAAKVSNYRRLVNGTRKVSTSAAAPYRANCPKDSDVDWHEVAAGLWPEAKARQLIMHAALCDHCGPLLRAATSADPTPEEAKLLTELKAPSRPDLFFPPGPASPSRRQFPRWLVPALALVAIVGAFIARHSSSMPLSGPQLAELAVRTHRQHERGQLPLEVSADSQQKLNQWFATKAPFSLALPASPAAPGEERPYRLEGARLVQVGDKTAAFIAYRTQTAELQTAPASLVVAPDSVAVASGGVEVDFKKVSFHYSTVEGYKVVTWSLHGLTYALVSEEGNNTQQSCMICHSAMRDRDLSHTPAPLRTQLDAIRSFL